MNTLNLGCGNNSFCDVRADFAKTQSANIICDCDRALPFKDEAFLFVKTEFLFEHISNPNLFLKEIERILKLEGTLFLLTDNASYWRFHVPKKYSLGFMHGSEHNKTCEQDKHYALYDLGHMKNHIQKSGLKLTSLALKDYDTSPRISVDSIVRVFFRVFELSHIFFPCIKVTAIKEKLK